ncbi:MAG: hypothetical protein H6Q71_1485 [Firmicutes bacterium]|nr:hypothetical protein [Bacillota bacterium]
MATNELYCINPIFVNDIDEEVTPSPKLRKLADFLNVSFNLFLNGEDTPKMITHSSIIQGHSIKNNIVNYGDSQPQDEQGAELMRLYNNLSIKGKASLILLAYDIEEKDNKK